MSRKGIYSRPILILGAVQLIESLAFALPLSFFPNYVITLGASIASVGLFTSSFMIAFAIMSPRMGALIDRYGKKRMMMYGIAGAREPRLLGRVIDAVYIIYRCWTG